MSQMYLFVVYTIDYLQPMLWAYDSSSCTKLSASHRNARAWPALVSKGSDGTGESRPLRFRHCFIIIRFYGMPGL